MTPTPLLVRVAVALGLMLLVVLGVVAYGRHLYLAGIAPARAWVGERTPAVGSGVPDLLYGYIPLDSRARGERLAAFVDGVDGMAPPPPMLTRIPASGEWFDMARYDRENARRFGPGVERPLPELPPPAFIAHADALRAGLAAPSLALPEGGELRIAPTLRGRGVEVAAILMVHWLRAYARGERETAVPGFCRDFEAINRHLLARDQPLVRAEVWRMHRIFAASALDLLREEREPPMAACAAAFAPVAPSEPVGCLQRRDLALAIAGATGEDPVHAAARVGGRCITGGEEPSGWPEAGREIKTPWYMRLAAPRTARLLADPAAVAALYGDPEPLAPVRVGALQAAWYWAMSQGEPTLEARLAAMPALPEGERWHLACGDRGDLLMRQDASGAPIDSVTVRGGASCPAVEVEPPTLQSGQRLF